MLEVMVKCIKEQGGLSSSLSVGAEKVHERPRSSRYLILNMKCIKLPSQRKKPGGKIILKLSK